MHEVITGARQDRSRVRTSSVAGAIQSLNFVRKAQVEPLVAILDTPLIAGYLAGAAIPRPRREALPLLLALLVQWERWICSGAPEHEIHFIGSILLMAWAGHHADAQSTCPSSLLPDRHVLRGECWRTKVSRSGSHLVLLPWFFLDDLHGVGATCQCASLVALPDGGLWRPELWSSTCLTHGLRYASNGGCNPHALQHGNDVSPSPPGRRCKTLE